MADDIFPHPAAAGYSPGSKVAGYQLEEQIGRGGMAVVFRAHDERHDREVALKILAPGLADDPVFRERFTRESRTVVQLDDPHIIPVYEADESDGVLFIAMRLVEGGDVGSLVRKDGPLPPGRAAEIVSQVASALDAAHARGLVHRDVKPANMLLDARTGRRDHAYLSDFGLTKAAQGSGGLTLSGQFLGTPGYVAPEQIQGKPVDGQADQYALACSAFEMLCGEPPFRHDHEQALMFAHLHEPPPSLSSRRAGLPGDLDGVLAKALAKSPTERYPSCQEFADALQAVLGLPAHAYAGARPERPATLRAAWPNPPVPFSAAETTPATPVAQNAGNSAHPVPSDTAPAERAHHQTTVNSPKSKGSDNRQPIAVAIIGACAVIIAAVIAILPAILAHNPPQRPTHTHSPTSPSHSPTSPSPSPPPASAVTVLMNEEVVAAKTRNLAIVDRIYAPTAFVKDAACRSPGRSTRWRGLAQIGLRYRAMPKFASLGHKFAQVRFMPDTSQAVRATAKAQTAGFIKPSATAPRGQYIHGDEVWTFALTGGRWLITSFTYNVCY